MTKQEVETLHQKFKDDTRAEMAARSEHEELLRRVESSGRKIAQLSEITIQSYAIYTVALQRQE